VDSAEEWEFLIIGSGFGGSVSALRLTEKGYRVLMLEMGSRLGAEDFPKTNWDLPRWMWRPLLGWRGLFRMTFFRHLTIVSGVGVGGGSLVYGNTLPIPNEQFFKAPSWGPLADWGRELMPHYQTVRRMLGATPNQRMGYPDQVLGVVARDMGLEHQYGPTTVGVFFGEAGKTVPDPYFNGEGPDRTGCNACGGCMIGCRYGAKNSLDKNYLYLAEKRGLTLRPDTEVTHIRPRKNGGYEVEALEGTQPFGRERRVFFAKNVILAGGVLGTVPLLLRMKADPEGLPHLSPRVGEYVRTNSEALIGVASSQRDIDMTEGVAIGAIVHTDEHSHMESMRYSKGSGFLRLLGAPHVSGATFWSRLSNMVRVMLRHPVRFLRAYFTPDFARFTTILLYMRTLEGYLKLRLGRDLHTGFTRGVVTELDEGPAPTASIPEATELAERVADKVDGLTMSLVTETLLGVPTTAHILGGACMGETEATGVIDHRHRVHGYQGLYVIDGSAVSANPGVNPSLTIAALAERAMTFIPNKQQAGDVEAEGELVAPGAAQAR
jgi:cholesterol oxidase